jgi:cytochrome c biogenesis protein CcmG/thiol:disulfide interchange protein DsbE
MNQQDLPSELDARPQSRREWSGWLRSLVLPLALVVTIVAGLLYVQANRGGTRQAEGLGTVSLPAGKNPTGQPPAASAGRAAPDFVLLDMDGREVRLSNLQGKPVVVNFWATWCPTCRAETPDLIRLHEDYEARGLVLLGVNLREADRPVRSFVDEFGISFPIVFDRTGQVASTWRIGGPNQGVPSTYFIDREGVVRKVVFGFLTEKLMDEGLALILTEGS